MLTRQSKEAREWLQRTGLGAIPATLVAMILGHCLFNDEKDSVVAMSEQATLDKVIRRVLKVQM